jgi:hypothetical protein
VRSRWEYLKKDVVQGRKQMHKNWQQLWEKEIGEKAYFLDDHN